MRKIEDIQEVQSILLGIAKEFRRICEKEHIPYYMIGGTMLGAIRHKGFIPWDDDMDFGVPRKDYLRLIHALEKELPQHIRSLTYQKCEQIKYPFVKIEDHRTCIDDPRLDCSLENKPGVNIDVFPLDYCNPNSFRLKLIFFLLRLQTIVFVESTSKSKLKKLIKHSLKGLMPFSRQYLIKHIDTICSAYEQGDFMGNVLGSYKKREIFQSTLFMSTKEYDFENLVLKGVSNYNLYLSQLYGDYMKLPSANQRVSHVETIYLR